MSDEQPAPRHRVLPPATPSRNRLAVAIAAVVAAGLVITGAVVLYVDSAQGLPESTAIVDQMLDDGAVPLSQRDPNASTSESGDRGVGTADGSSADKQAAAKAEKAAKKRSNALAKIAERLAANQATPPPLSFRIATLNVLGSSHTAASGNKSGYASGAARMSGALSLLDSQGVDVVGLQEFEAAQKGAFDSLTGGAWDFYTGSSRGRESIAWRTSAWSYVDGGTRLIPYFGGNRLPMPWVQLKSVETGRQIFVISIHNPTSNSRRGNNARWRDLATTLEIDWARDLNASGYPVLLTGDFNEKVAPFCRTTSIGMVASNGGLAAPCSPPAQSGIDWIFATPELTFSNHARIDGGTVNRVTDHPMIVATATYDGPVPATSTP